MTDSNKIQIVFKSYGDPNSPESTAAKSIAECFKKMPDNVEGSVFVASNITLPGGYDVKDIDIVVLGKLKNCSLRLNCAAKISDTETEASAERDVFINSFCYVVELKDHVAESVRLDGLSDLQVKYNEHWHSASAQSLKQQYSFVNFLRQEWNCSPYIRNVIWLRQLREYEYNQLFSKYNLNAFFGKVDLYKLFSSAILSSQAEHYPFKTKSGKYVVNDFYRDSKEKDKADFEKLLNIFSEQKESCGELTRQKLELFTRDYVREKIPEDMGNKLTIFEGRAGTGKTVNLIQIAFKLAYEKGARCLLLTYNHALVSDIKRILAFSGIPDGIDSETVQIQTLHSFFFELFSGYGVHSGGLVPDRNFESIYKSYLDDLLSKLNDKQDDELQSVKNCEAISWDYILIDEAQDWSEVEKNILFKIFGEDRIIVADGVDQFMRSNPKIYWGKGLQKEQLIQHHSKLGLRQKYNLSVFVNAFAEKCGLDWRVEPNESISGGTIKIYKNYTVGIHKTLCDCCKYNKCENYDILILEPACMIKKDETGVHFKSVDLYEKAGIKIFDGTNYNNRTTYPTKDECRLYQYHSCRGLEGWCVVCDGLDLLYQHLVDNWKPTGNELGLDQEKMKERYAFLWTMMPLTRPIDTLVITLKDPNSKVGQLLKKLADIHKDYVGWYI